MVVAKSLEELLHYDAQASDFIDTMQEYARSNREIPGETVRAFLNKANFEGAEFDRAYRIAEQGLVDHVKQGYIRAAVENLDALNAISEKQAAMGYERTASEGALDEISAKLREAHETTNELETFVTLREVVQQFKQYAVSERPPRPDRGSEICYDFGVRGDLSIGSRYDYK